MFAPYINGVGKVSAVGGAGGVGSVRVMARSFPRRNAGEERAFNHVSGDSRPPAGQEGPLAGRGIGARVRA